MTLSENTNSNQIKLEIFINFEFKTLMPGGKKKVTHTPHKK